MPKTKLSGIDLAAKYLKSIGVNEKTIDLKLFPSRFYGGISPITKLAKSDIVTNNKESSSHQSHIAVNHGKWPLFFTTADIKDYEHDNSKRHESLQAFEIFEANIASMLERRSISTSPLLKQPTSSTRTYSIATDSIISANAYKWIDSNKGATQIRLSMFKNDSAEFSDFRLGIQVQDYLVMLKDKYTDIILAISIPSEFADMYDISDALSSRKIITRKTKTVDDMEQLEDDAYVHKSSESSELSIPAGPQPAIRPSKTKTGKVFKANPGIGKSAMKHAGYICENDSAHTTFIARSSGKNYMEPHHLIPISKQDLFSSGLDVPENIICLCPNCHSKIHYGEKNEIKILLRKFLAARKSSLSARGLEILESELFALYDL